MMNEAERQKKENELLKCMCDLPKRLIDHHGKLNLTEFLLHSLCTKCCFNFSKAAFFVDNPDFDHLKGVAGFFVHESYPDGEHWNSPDNFSSHMETSPFNQKVRAVLEKSPKRGGKPHDSIVRSLAEDLEMESPLHRVWNVKHGNHGLLVFEANEDDRAFIDGHLEKALYLFGFCPVF